MRWLIRSVLALSLLVFLAVAAVFMIPSERIAALAAERFAEVTGRKLVIEGSVRPSFFPTLGVQTGPVSVSNADWGTEGDMLRAEELSISLDLAALMGGEVKITGISAQAPQLVLERARDGRENWVFGGRGGGSAEAGMAGEGTPFTLDLAEVSDGRFTFVDHGAGSRIVLRSVNGEARIPAFLGAADFTFDAIMNDQPFEASVKLAEFAPFLEGRLVGVDLALTAGEADLRFAGQAGWNPLAAKGDLVANLADLSAITTLEGMAKPDLPQGLGAQRVEATGRLTLTDALSVHLREGTLRLDDNRLTLDADLTTAGERPNLSAQVQAGALSLAAAMSGQGGEIGGGARGGTQADGWPTAPIDVSALGLMDASIALTADSVDLGVAKFGTTRVVTTIDRARAVFDLRQIAAYQGTVSGQFVVNGRSGLSVGGDLVLSGLAMQSLLMDLGGYDRLIGTGDLALKFLGVGNSVDAIMRSFSGSGSLRLGKGELRGLDIAGMLRTLDAGFVGEGQKTIFEAVTAGFTIDGGVLSNSDLAFQAPYVTATGNGEVNLGARTLDYRLRPVALAAVDGTGGVMVPLLITGSWASPKFRLDLEALARERFEEQAKEAEARAKAELERKAEQELGIVRQEGESLEDAARRRAQEAIDAEAARLLQRLLGGGN
ncbi:AsmA family protein [Pseudotabrizicola alkalilacus]|uniref:AsmA family protein n=1 Tax=Pseudotabrizicola alkalilacus TaxID=2305252 RepID=A0A411YWV0_9RHOB|nr:AsmA family protein [Pseudotabrizicola alkalilacus]RGP35326.1 AsmA family protein [Pseudotabrizicola alkalilacus]